MVLRNRMAAFLWGFAALWWGLLLIFTWLLARDGPPDGYSPGTAWGIVALFWLGGLGFAGFALSRPCVLVSVEPQGTVRLTWRYPHRSVRKEFPAAEIGHPVVVEGRDDEGAPYFHARLGLPDGTTADLAEGHDRETCEAACRRFRVALARAAR